MSTSLNKTWKSFVGGRRRWRVIAVIGAVGDQILRLRLNHLKIKTQLHQPHFVMIRRMGTDRQGKAVTVHDPHDFHTPILSNAFLYPPSGQSFW